MTTTLKVEEVVNARVPKRRRLPPSPRSTVLITLLVRLGWLLGIHVHSHVVGESGFNAFPYGGLDDGRYYYTTAQQLADGITPPYVLNSFPRVLAVLMDLGIRDLLALKMISFAVSSIAVVMIASLAWHLSAGMRLEARRWTVVVASVFASLFPSNVFWTTNSLMRDGWILSFALVAIWSFSGAGKSVLPRSRWALGIVALAAATSFRPYFLPIYIAALFSSGFGFMNPMARLSRRVIPVAFRLTLLAIAFIGVCLVVAPVLTDITGFNILGWRSQEQLSGKGSSMGLRFDGADPLIVVPYYLASFVSNAVGPLPFQVKSANQMLAFVEFPFFIIIVAGLFKANYSNRLIRFCALFGLYWLLLLGLWNDVLGNAARNRIMAWPILALAASPAIAQFIASRLDTGRPRGAGGGRRRSERRTKLRRAGADPVLATDGVEPSKEDPFVPVSAMALAQWCLIDDEGVSVEVRRSSNERRSDERRGDYRRTAVLKTVACGGEETIDGLSAHSNGALPAAAEPVGDAIEADESNKGPRAGVDFPLFRPPGWRVVDAPVVEASTSGDSDR